jgi:hypothetical protein
MASSATQENQGKFEVVVMIPNHIPNLGSWNGFKDFCRGCLTDNQAQPGHTMTEKRLGVNEYVGICRLDSKNDKDLLCSQQALTPTHSNNY